MSQFYVEQHKNFGLGNFINCTPTIRGLYHHHGKVNVLFQSEYVKQCYLESEMINIIEEPTGKRLFGSEMINQKKPDYIYIQEQILGTTGWQPFIDKCYSIGGDYGVFINGSGNQSKAYCDAKCVGEDVQELIQRLSPVKVIGVGSNEDKDRNIFDGYYGNIRDALSYIRGARFVISNDTGLYHAAGVFKKEQLVLWKNTNLEKNRNTNAKCVYAKQHQWKESIQRFLSGFSA